MVELYVNDIENALKNKSYFSALAMSLALPDICGAAEYPNETSTAKRYIEWYNKYLGEYMSDDSGNPYLSGEIVYNLRNTFLHAGSPNIDSNKIKDEANQLDRFMLFLGDGTEMCVTLFINTSIVKLRSMIVDVTYLCKTIRDRSLWYYKNNTNKFHFDFSIDTQDHFYSGEGKLPSGDPIIEALNQKLEQSGDTRRFQESQDHNMTDVIIGGFINYVFSNEELKQRYLYGEKIKLVRTMPPTDTPIITSNTESTVKKESAPKKKTASPSKKKTKPDKREAQVRSFFGQHFKEKKYKQKKEIIIQAILKSKTKQQVNNALMKSFASEETGVIYKRLSPLLASLPGK